MAKHFSYFLTYILGHYHPLYFFVICPLEFFRSPIWKLAKHFIFLNYCYSCRGHQYHYCIFRNMPIGIFYRSPIWNLAKHYIFHNLILCRGHYHHCIFRNMPIGILSVTHLRELAKHVSYFLTTYLCRGHYHHCIFRNMHSGIFSVTHLKVGKTFHIS